MKISKLIFGFLLLVHGLIHLLGFVKAFRGNDIDHSFRSIPSLLGFNWLLAAMLFLISLTCFLMRKAWWPEMVVTAVVISQILIFLVWTDPKFGTIANVIILMVAVVGFASIHFEKSYKTDVKSAFESIKLQNQIVTEKELQPLPPVVQNYLRYVGVVGKPKVATIKIVFDGEMRERGKDWFRFTSEQYNFFNDPTRLFFMKAKVKRLPTVGYHSYNNEGARMRIKLLSLFPLVDLAEPELFPTETVTFFNDMCLFAPSGLIDKRISWEVVDEFSVRATFKTNGATISAKMYFNKKGQLINFVSTDRYSVAEMKSFQFSTPVNDYRNVNGYNLPTYGEAIWHYPEGEFVYGKFYVKTIEYNVSSPR